ncbi:MAG TPA: M67 family metallopeptidase [Vicinamibacteria bacterium]
MKIAQALVEKMLAHARSGYPNEACGMFLGRPAGAGPALVEDVVPVENRETEKPRVRYAIAPEDHIRIDRDARLRGLEILGYFHSHPDHPARPSETDRQRAADTLSDGVIHVVVGVENGERAIPTAWIFRDAKQAFEDEAFEIV